MLYYNTMEEVNSTLCDKPKKLFIKISSLLSSAENFQTLKLYDDSLKLLTEARDLTKSLSKKDISESKELFTYLENNIRNKIKTVEMLNIIEKEIKTNKHAHSPIKEQRINNEHAKDEIINTINNMIQGCNMNLRELSDKKPVLEKSMLINHSINQSFFIPNKDVFNFNEDLVENMEVSFKGILNKLNDLKILFSSEETLRAKKDKYTKNLEKLKGNYAHVKKICEIAIRSNKKNINLIK
jgi:hypothetical protein